LQTKHFAIFVNSSALRWWFFLQNFGQQQLQMNSENDDTKTSLQQSINQKRMHHNETCLCCHQLFVNNSRVNCHQSIWFFWGGEFPTTAFHQSNCPCMPQMRNLWKIKLMCILIKWLVPQEINCLLLTIHCHSSQRCTQHFFSEDAKDDFVASGSSRMPTHHIDGAEGNEQHATQRMALHATWQKSDWLNLFSSRNRVSGQCESPWWLQLIHGQSHPSVNTFWKKISNAWKILHDTTVIQTMELVFAIVSCCHFLILAFQKPVGKRQNNNVQLSFKTWKHQFWQKQKQSVCLCPILVHKLPGNRGLTPLNVWVLGCSSVWLLRSEVGELNVNGKLSLRLLPCVSLQ